MRKRMYRSAASFNVRSDAGSVVQPPPRFSSEFVADALDGYAAVSDEEVIAEALRILSERVVRSNPLSNPRVVREYLVMRFADLEYEVFCCVYLNNRNRVIACEELFRGTIDGANVHPREVVKQALVHNAAAVILAHNSPSGSPEPSEADKLITLHLKRALGLVDIRLADHIIVGGAETLSMTEQGLT